jgi:geranylgeranyl diphosphate synthase type II
MDFITYLKHQTLRMEEALPRCLDDLDMPPLLKEAMLYSLMAGGKRMRPLMVLAAAEAVSGTDDAAMSVACAIEMIHTYSLIHDDLPAMDDDDYRRGKLTNHKVYGEAIAILAGDALLTHAFGMIAGSSSDQGTVPAEVKLRVSSELARYAGPCGMVGGQTADILGEQGITEIAELEYIHTHKTGDLIVFSLRAGGWYGGGSPEQIEALEQFGRKLGLAFQIQDDILDLIGDEKKLGKRAGSDILQEKVTYPSILGLDRCHELVAQLTLEAKTAIAAGGIANPRRLYEIADYLMRRDH